MSEQQSGSGRPERDGAEAVAVPVGPAPGPLVLAGVLVAVAVAVLLAALADVAVDVARLGPVLLVVAGAALVATSVLAGLRPRRR